MPLLHKLGSLTRKERRAASEAVLLVPIIRLALWSVPFRYVRSWVERVPVRSRTEMPERESIEAAVWSVAAVSLRVPRATCLTQALALKVMLARRGFDSDLRVGVAKERVYGISAHAWIERDGEVLIGGDMDALNAYALFKHSHCSQESETSS